eukprot:SAG25_NODE_691_length_5916_cov_9.126698_1_plen_111_part_10
MQTNKLRLFLVVGCVAMDGEDSDGDNEEEEDRSSEDDRSSDDGEVGVSVVLREALMRGRRCLVCARTPQHPRSGQGAGHLGTPPYASINFGVMGGGGGGGGGGGRPGLRVL